MVQVQDKELTSPQYRQLKSRLHGRVLEEVDLDSLNRLDQETARDRIVDFLHGIIEHEKAPLALASIRHQASRHWCRRPTT